MLIGPPQIERTEDGILLSAEIGVETRRPALPATLQFSMRKADESMFSTSADPFLIGLVPVAMRIGESIRVSSPVSVRLAHGLVEYQAALATWFPQLYRQVPIEYDALETRRDVARPSGVGCTFSGGVDSFFSLVRGTGPAQSIADYRLTHALMVNGFDQITDETGSGYILDMERVYRPVLAEFGVELLIIHTNVRRFRSAVIEKGYMSTSLSSPLMACAHALGLVFGRFSLAGHGSYADLKPSGTHPALDHHLSTDQLQVMHGVAAVSRSDRVAELADLSAFRSAVRVCTRAPRFDAATGGVVNCCECEKCLRTMIALDILGRLDEFATFPKKKAIAAYKKSPVRFVRHPTNFVLDNYRLAQEMKRSDWSAALEQAIRLGQAAKRATRR